MIGSHRDIESAELGDVRDFFKTYYAPNNATMAIVGDFDPMTIKDIKVVETIKEGKMIYKAQ